MDTENKAVSIIKWTLAAAALVAVLLIGFGAYQLKDVPEIVGTDGVVFNPHATTTPATTTPATSTSSCVNCPLIKP